VTDEKGPAEHAIDLIVYAPLGFALEARTLLPTFVERGRQQVQMARMIGRFAVSQGQVEGRKRLSRAQEQAETILAELGLAPMVGTGREAPVSPSPAPLESSASPPPSRPAPQASAASADLAISGYDSLAASQVIPRLAGLDADELEAVRVYEAAHRARKTILGKIAQLQGG
jgi:hypothetical protein